MLSCLVADETAKRLTRSVCRFVREAFLSSIRLLVRYAFRRGIRSFTRGLRRACIRVGLRLNYALSGYCSLLYVRQHRGRRQRQG